MESWLWCELHDLFETDDGSLPEFHICFSNPEEMIAAYSLLKVRAARVAPEEPTFWSVVNEADVPLDAVENAAAHVAKGEAEPFHVLLRGIRAIGVEIPDLGVFVFPNELCLDYRMGSHWRGQKLEALFSLLGELVSLAPSASISLGESVSDDVKLRFRRAWLRWTAGQGEEG